jgi:hypothetical protein
MFVFMFIFPFEKEVCKGNNMQSCSLAVRG